jgi:hypothetical protein
MAFLIRLWQVNDQPHSAWRASVQDPHTGERRGFADLKELFVFLEEQTNNADQPSAGETAG